MRPKTGLKLPRPLTFRTESKFGKIEVPFVLGICEIFYIASYTAHIIDCIMVKTFTCLHLVDENTSETFKN